MKPGKWIFAFSAGMLAGSIALAQQSGLGSDAQSSRVQAQTQLHPENLQANEIRKVQSALNDAGFQAGAVDGIWGTNTEAALRNFQQARGLDATGRLDEPTVLALGFSRDEFAAAEFSDPATLKDTDIRRVQETLKREGYDVGVVDGIWGPRTEGALREFQQAKGISPTGQLNEDTVLALGFSVSEFAAGEFDTGNRTNGQNR